MYINFPMTKKATLVSIDKLSEKVVSRANASNGNWGLPSETNITLADGSTRKANITWNVMPTFDSSNKYAQQVKAQGTVTLPNNVVTNGVDTSISISILIPTSDRAQKVKANIDSGTYKGTKYIELSCDTDNVDIYYTLDGSVPSVNSLLYKEPIKINESKTLRAIAVRSDMLNSFESIYTYTFNSSKKPDSKDDNPSTVTDCQSAYGKNWTWSNSKQACVYKVLNTGVK